jgi:hypothetical protein
MKNQWTAQQDAIMARMAADLHSIPEIAAATGQTMKAVRYRMEILGIPRLGRMTESRKRRAADGVGVGA